MAGKDEVTAVFADNDQMTLGLLRALHERGRAVSDEVRVVGFDDMGESAHFWPPLTTVRRSFASVGRRTVDTVIEEIQSGPRRRRSVRVATELVVRGSTDAPSRAS